MTGGIRMFIGNPILVTGAPGSVGGVGRTVVELLRQRNLPVRAFVRGEDEIEVSI
jgi:NAD(P)H dehydrogenase (quinone)